MDLIKVKKSRIHGRGIFANTRIKKGQVIERSPYILVNGTVKGELENYVFAYSKTKSLVALMYGSIFNHANKPNIDHIIDVDNKVMEYIAIQDIPAGQECFIDYGEDYWKQTKTKRK